MNKSWRQHPTKQQLYGHQAPITKTIQVRRTRHAGHCWRSGDELISNVLQWTPSHGRAKPWRPARTYIQELCADTGCCLEDLPGAMDNKGGWRERVREIRTSGVRWWWWWWWLEENSVSLLRFPFLSHVQVFSGEISVVCRWKWPYSCFLFSIFVFCLFLFCWCLCYLCFLWSL